ncbi:MAG: sensor histidine kinase [Oscillatoriales cyanobacterium]|nr:MAG: sensor histidine kinase [Oscillatoriales cyanobacterium]
MSKRSRSIEIAACLHTPEIDAFMSMPVRFLPRSLLQLANRASLRAALSTSYLLQMAIVIGLTAGLAWRTIDRTGLYLTRQQQEAITQRVSDRLKEDQRQVLELKQLASDAIALNLWSGEGSLERWLWQQMRAQGATAIGLRNPQGRSLAILRQADGTLISLERLETGRPPVAYRLDDNGERLDTLVLEDIKQLTLYGALFETSEKTDLPIVQFPLLNPNVKDLNRRPSLLAIAVPTAAIDDLLYQLYLGQHGLVAVVDRYGQPLASSADRLKTSTEAGSSRDALAVDPNNVILLERIMMPLRDLDGTLSAVDQPQQQTVKLNGRRYQVAVSPVELQPDRTLWIVSAIVDRDFGSVGHRDAIGFVAISALAALVVGGVNLLKVRTTIRAIARLQGAIEALGQQRWGSTRLTQQPPEFRPVSASVAQAAQVLQATITELKDHNTHLQASDRFKTMLFDDSIQKLSPSLQAIVSGAETDCRLLTKTARQTLSLLANAVELSQLQADRLDLTLQPVGLTACLERAIAQHQTEIEAQEIRIERHDDLTTVWVCVNPQRLEWVLHELIENALQFSHHGSTIVIATTIAVSAIRSTYHDLPEVSISITDFGTGIDPSEHHKLFQPFARMTRHHPERCGYGLGLAIAHQIISLMGGRLELESSGIDCGTTARVTLPVASPSGLSQAADWDATTDLPLMLNDGESTTAI